MQIFFLDIRIVHDLETHIIQALQGTNTGGSYSNGATIVGYQSLDSMTAHSNILRMHLVLANRRTLDRTESAGTDMQRQFLALDTLGIECAQDSIRKMEASRRRSHTALDFRINRLISCQVAFLRLAIQIWRNRQFAHCIQYLCKTDSSVVPLEVYPLACAMFASASSLNF